MSNVDRVDKFMEDQFFWSGQTFGFDYPAHPRAGVGSLHHCAEEVQELIDDPSDKEEWADVFILLFDAASRRGIPFSDIMDWVEAKYEKNTKRKWGEPDENGVVHHIKEEV